MLNSNDLNNLSKEELISLVLNLQSDALTGCYKREVLSTITKDNYVVAMVDINDLKIVNDTRGHAVGDAYILGVAESIKSNVRKEDVVIRYGGDEFVIIFDCCLLDAYKAVKRISHASCGIAEHKDLETAIKLADADMYINKRKYHKALV